MKPEIEVKFLNVNHGELREKLQSVGAVCEQPMRLMRRAIIDYPDGRMRTKDPEAWSWVRVRDEGDKVMLTYKRVAKDGKDTTHEIEFDVSSYESAVALFEAIGLERQSEQKTRRESWRLDGCEIELDEWPWLNPMVEIEGHNEDALQAVAAKLGLNWSNVWRGNADTVYRKEYPGMSVEESVGELPELTFTSMPDWLEARRRAATESV